MTHLDHIDGDETAQRNVQSIAKDLIEAGRLRITVDSTKSARLIQHVNGIEVRSAFEVDKRTKQIKPINFDVYTSQGMVRCGSSAMTAAALIVGIGIGEATSMAKPQKTRRYKIVRFYRDDAKSSKVIRTGLTLEAAQAHCKRDDTRGDGWFDGYTLEVD